MSIDISSKNQPHLLGAGTLPFAQGKISKNLWVLRGAIYLARFYSLPNFEVLLNCEVCLLAKISFFYTLILVYH